MRLSMKDFLLSRLPCLWFSCCGIFRFALAGQRLFKDCCTSIPQRHDWTPSKPCCSNFTSLSSFRTSTRITYTDTAAAWEMESGLSSSRTRQLADSTHRLTNLTQTATRSIWYLRLLFVERLDRAPSHNWEGKTCPAPKPTTCFSCVFSWP